MDDSDRDSKASSDLAWKLVLLRRHSTFFGYCPQNSQQIPNMDDSPNATVAVTVIGLELPVSAQEIKAKKRRATDTHVTSFRAATPLRDLLDPQVLLEPSSSSGSDPNSGSSDPSTGDDTSPSSFLGTPYSTSLQFDYPFPISNAPRDPVYPPAQPLSALPIASSIASAPSLVTAAASVAAESPDQAASSPLPSLVSTIAASMEVAVNTTLSELRNLPNKSTSSLGSTHSGHTAPAMVPVASSSASIHSISPSSSYQSHSQSYSSPPGSAASAPGRQKARHSLVISPLPPPPLSIHTNIPKPAASSPNHLKRPKFNKAPSNASDASHDSNASHSRSRPTSGSVSSLSIASLQFLSNPGEPPIPPSLLNKLNRPRHQTSQSINANSYFSPVSTTQKTQNSRDFFASPYDSSAAVSAPSSPPTTLNTDSSVSEFFKPVSPPANKAGFSVFRPPLGRSNSTNGPNPSTSSTSSFSRPFFGRSNTTNSQLQSRAYAQHLRHQQQQQLKQEEQRKKEELKRKLEKERKEKKSRRGSLSLSRSASGSSMSSARTRNSSSTKSKSPSSSNSQTDGFKLSPTQTQTSLAESAVSESEGSASPEGTKIRRRSSVRRILEKTGSLVGFNLSLDKARYGHGNGNTSPKDGKKSPKQRSGKSSPKDGGAKSPSRSGHVSPKRSDTN